MQKEYHWWKCLVSSILIITLMFCVPFEAFAQSSDRAKLLEYGTPVVMRVDDNYKVDSSVDNGTINATIETDVYSADGTQVLIKAGTPVFLEYSAESNGAWGKAGKICITNAFTKAVDNKRIPLRLSTCKKGGSKLAGVIILSVLFFPLGLFSGFMKGSMPQIKSNTTFNATVMQDIEIE